MSVVQLESWTCEEAIAYWNLDGPFYGMTKMELAELVGIGRHPRWQEKLPPGVAEARRIARRMRRRYAEMDAVEPIVRRVVFERDGWICQLCGEPVDPDLRAPDPESASLDHRIPIARGGDHTYDNIQLAHFGCNARKGAGRQ